MSLRRPKLSINKEVQSLVEEEVILFTRSCREVEIIKYGMTGRTDRLEEKRNTSVLLVWKRVRIIALGRMWHRQKGR
jgi:hypothetical protein